MSEISDLLRFIPHETEEGLSEIQILVTYTIKYVNNKANKPATYKDIIFVIKAKIDNNICNHSPESYSRAVRKLVELGIIKKVQNGLFYHPQTLYGHSLE